ncbi:hypothetical protein BGZ57DRAFT_786541, partial [Hyaloscypha finlandica]
MGIDGVDLNDDSNRSLFADIVLFKNNILRDDMLFIDPDQPTQRAVQAIAHSLDLEYEFSLATRNARITRRLAFHTSDDAVAHLQGLSTSQWQAHAGNPPPVPNFWDDPLAIDQGFPLGNDGEDCASLDLCSWLQDLGPPAGSVNGILEVTERTGQTENFPSTDKGQDQLHHHSPSYHSAPSRAPPPLEIENGISYIDDMRAANSPPLRPTRVNLQPTPSPPPTNRGIRRSSSRPSQEDAVLMPCWADGSDTFETGIATGSKSHVSNGDSSDPPGRFSSRRASLGTIARASSKAVKALGACWRCRVLRDKCDTTTPCAMCSGSTKLRGLGWFSVGCKRGSSIRKEMAPIEMCPQLVENPQSLPEFTMGKRPTLVNMSARDNLLRRELALENPGTLVTENGHDIDALLQQHEGSWLALQGFRLSRYSQDEHPSLPTLLPLDNCVMSITWEILDLSALCLIQDGDIVKFIVLLRSASLYQARSEKDELISQSLLCLLTCLEVKRLATTQSLTPLSHQFCTKSPLPTCKVNCIENLSLYLNKFLDELSRVFFQKQDMRSKAWWLPIFYSFCIQAVVRRALITLTEGPQGQRFELTWVKEYLHLAVRLFISTSGSYDPLTQSFEDDGSLQSGDLSKLEDYEAARVALGVPSNDFTSSGDYLKRIFEDSGEPLSYDTLPRRRILSMPIGSDSFLRELSPPRPVLWPYNHTQSQNQRAESYQYQSGPDYSSSTYTPSTASSSGTRAASMAIDRVSIDRMSI